MAIGADSQAVFDELDKLFETRTQAEWMAHFKEVDCCVSPVLTVAEAMEHDQIRARGMVREESHPAEGDVTQFAMPFRSSSYDFSLRNPGPELGEHTDGLLAAAGYDPKAIAALREQGII